MEIPYSFLEDSALVLERLGGNEALFGALIVKFGESYADSLATLGECVAKGQTEEAYRIVHSIKGVAGNLGIGALYRSSISLEARMKAGEYRLDSLEASGFASELGSVLAEITQKKGGNQA